MKTEILSSTDKEALKLDISNFCEGKKIISCQTTGVKTEAHKVGMTGAELSDGTFAAHHHYPEMTNYTTTILYEESVE